MLFHTILDYVAPFVVSLQTLYLYSPFGALYSPSDKA